MKTLLIATATIALLAGGPSQAQRVVAHGPSGGMSGGMHMGNPGGMPMGSGGMHMGHPGGMNPGMRPPMPGRPPMVHAGQPRWGSKVGGHWWGGANAPGGWGAYRRPYRGYSLPSYWVSPRFYVSDWSGYGLSQPGYGYNWVRYYDDAVLIDGRGSVYDTVGGVDWDRYDDGYYTDDAQVYAGGEGQAGYAQDGYGQGGYAQDGYAQGGAPGAGYAQPGYAPQGYDNRVYRRPNNGVGGAVVGGVVGGVAGNRIAGRGNRLGGTLIGAGVGALVGQQVDKSVTADRRARYGTTYASPGYGGRPPIAPDYAPPPPPPRYGGPAPVVQPLPPQGDNRYDRGDGHWVSPNGTTVVTTNGNGYGGSTTTVVVQTAPVVTTTTTEIYEDAVTYVKKPVRHWKAKRVWRPRPVCRCY